MSLKGKCALVTGSSRGIGRGIALKLAEKGSRVGIHYYEKEAAAKDTLAQVRERGSDGFVVQADVSRPGDIARMFNKVQAEFGRPLQHPVVSNEQRKGKDKRSAPGSTWIQARYYGSCTPILGSVFFDTARRLEILSRLRAFCWCLP